MRISADIGNLQAVSRPVVALDCFDGVHLGHQEAIKVAIARTKAINGSAFALVLDPQPPKEPSKKPSQALTTRDDRVTLLYRLGVDGVVVVDSLDDSYRFDPEAFIREVLMRCGRVSEIVVGTMVDVSEEHSVKADSIVALGKKYGFKVHVVPLPAIDGVEVNSTKIRELIQAGNVGQAAKMLGRPHFLVGKVVRGFGRGRKIGFPTVNLECETGCVPPNGVYAERVIVDDRVYPAIGNIGVRPTFDGGERSIEAHLLDFQGDLYGKRIKIELIARIRDEKKFASAEELSKHIAEDIRKVKAVLASSSF